MMLGSYIGGIVVWIFLRILEDEVSPGWIAIGALTWPFILVVCICIRAKNYIKRRATPFHPTERDR